MYDFVIKGKRVKRFQRRVVKFYLVVPKVTLYVQSCGIELNDKIVECVFLFEIPQTTSMHCRILFFLLL